MPKVDTKSKKLTYNDFDIGVFETEKKLMEDFRTNAGGEDMVSLWRMIKDSYMPDNTLENIFTQYTVDPDGTSTPNKLFLADDDDERIQIEEPLVAIKVHTALSILTQRSPQVRWDSKNELYEERVPVLNAMRNADWDDHDTRSQYVLLWFNFIMYGTAYWRRYFRREERTVFLPSRINLATDEVEFEEQKRLEFDQTVGETLSPFDVLIDPATEPMKPSSMRKVIYKKVFDYDTFSRLFQDVASRKNFASVVPGIAEGYQGDKWVEVDFYENKDLDLYFVVANKQELIKSHLPQNHKELSVKMAIWMPRRDARNPFGLGPIEMMIPDKKQLDRFKSMTLTQLKFSIYKSIFYTGSLESEGEGGDIRIRPDRAYKVTNPKDIQFYDMPGPGAEAWKAMEILRSKVDDASGINRPLGGEIVKTTAFQTDLAKDAALARLSVPINNIVHLLEQDAEITFELQKQHLALPDVEEIVDPDKIEAAFEELRRVKLSGKPATFDIFIDVNEETGEPQIFRSEFRTTQLQFETTEGGEIVPSLGKQEVVLTPDLFDWKGKIRVVQDSLFSITPTVERTRKMEMYNLLIPLFGQPPQLVAKVAREIVRLYGGDSQDILPEDWLVYLKGIQDGTIPAPQQPGAEAPQEELKRPPGRPREFGPRAREALKFEQARAPKVISNIGGQKDLISAQSERISP